MVTLNELAQKETDTPKTADLDTILRNVDELQAAATLNPENDTPLYTALLYRYARRISPTCPPTKQDSLTVINLAAAGHKASQAAQQAQQAYQRAYEHIRAAAASGMSQSEIARVSHLDRMTVRKALGLQKTRPHHTPQTGDSGDAGDYNLILAQHP